MRRGLIAWSKEEIPDEVLARRVARVQEALGQAAELDALFAYTSFARPAAGSWLTQFIPYWSEGFVAVLPEGLPVLLISLSKRVFPWIREVSRVGDILPAPQLGKAAAGFAAKHGLRRIGLVDLDELPWSVAQAIDAELIDATDLFAGLRQPADDAETRLVARATQIAERAFAAVPENAVSDKEILASVERSARLDGAEEVLARITRYEPPSRFALEVSVAYKGAWARVCHTFPRVTDAEAWFRRVLEQGRLPADARDARWTVESCIGCRPLSVAADTEREYRRLPSGAQAVLSVKLALEQGEWRAAAPFLVRA